MKPKVLTHAKAVERSGHAIRRSIEGTPHPGHPPENRMFFRRWKPTTKTPAKKQEEHSTAH
jgi:hypothetical protein